MIVEQRGGHRPPSGDGVGISFETESAYLFDKESGARIR